MEYEKILLKIIDNWNEDNDLQLHPDVRKALANDLITNKIPHSSKDAKKASQQYRREARRVLGGYQEQLKGNLDNFNKALRKRPKYCPNWLWRYGAHFFIDISVIEKPIFKTEKNLSTD